MFIFNFTKLTKEIIHFRSHNMQSEQRTREEKKKYFAENEPEVRNKHFAESEEHDTLLNAYIKETKLKKRAEEECRKSWQLTPTTRRELTEVSALINELETQAKSKYGLTTFHVNKQQIFDNHNNDDNLRSSP